MVAAEEIPMATMNETEARFRAIWWAASGTVPIHPTMIEEAAKALTSKKY